MHSTGSENSQKNRNTSPVKFIHITEGEKASGQATFEGSISDYLIKCRSTVGIFKAAEEQGVLKPGMEIIEPAFDCAGVIIAYVAADRGYKGVSHIYGNQFRPLPGIPRSPPIDYSTGCIEGR